MRWESRTTPPTCPYLETARVEYLRWLGHPYRELRDRDGIEFAVVGVTSATTRRCASTMRSP